VQRIEADAVGAHTVRQFDQAFEVSEIADPRCAPKVGGTGVPREAS
jgi:hypothetical protein